MLKVIVTGAYSTGKSTLVDALAMALLASGRTVAKVPDVARGSPVPLNAAQNADASLWLIATQVAREVEAAQGPEEVMLCDRGVPDVLAHDLDLAASGGWVAPLRPFLDRWLSSYDLLLFARIDERIPIAADGLRVEDPAYRTRLDRCAAAVLDGRQGVSELPLGSAERLAYAIEAIERSLDAVRRAATT